MYSQVSIRAKGVRRSRLKSPTNRKVPDPAKKQNGRETDSADDAPGAGQDPGGPAAPLDQDKGSGEKQEGSG